ncbi:hypothetical protein [Methylobacterium sp. B4]|nr:hypothetical protein [Methylobacterium sp. B4]
MIASFAAFGPYPAWRASPRITIFQTSHDEPGRVTRVYPSG